MKEEKRDRIVIFADSMLKHSFEKLKEGKFEDRQLAEFIDRAFDDLKENPFVGIKLPKKLWPKEYVQKYLLKNLWKYDLPNGWRLLYTIKGETVRILTIILEWITHKDYERKVKYKRS